MLEGVEKREPPSTIGGNINWCSHHGKHYGGSSEKPFVGGGNVNLYSTREQYKVPLKTKNRVDL